MRSIVATLPSGVRVRVQPPLHELTLAPPVEREKALATLLEAMEMPDVVARDDGAALSLGELPLGDVHVLLMLGFRLGHVLEPEHVFACENCEAPLRVRPSSQVEIGPFVDGELDDPELDRPFDFAASHPVPPLFTPRGAQRTLRLSPRILDEARVLFRGPVRTMTKSLVLALGISAIGAERKTAALARALARASDDAWTTFGQLWEDAHCPPRLFAEVRCPVCNARNDVVAPAVRPFDYVAEVLQGGPPEAPAMTLDDFTAAAERYRAEVYDERGVRNLALVIDEGVPAVDDGGHPLLGSYQPGQSGDDLDLGETRAEVRLYYRSFMAELRLDPSYDLHHEIRETIDHEVEHHLYYLAGDDPMDRQERAVIAQERARVVGKKELVRRELRGAAADLRRFIKVAAPLFAILILIAALRFCSH